MLGLSVRLMHPCLMIVCRCLTLAYCDCETLKLIDLDLCMNVISHRSQVLCIRWSPHPHTKSEILPPAAEVFDFEYFRVVDLYHAAVAH